MTDFIDKGMVELEKELEKDIKADTYGIKSPQEEYNILNLQDLANKYNEELKVLRRLRKSLVEKREWINNSINILDKRIEVNLGALHTLQTHKIVKEDDEKEIYIEVVPNKKR